MDEQNKLKEIEEQELSEISGGIKVHGRDTSEPVQYYTIQKGDTLLKIAKAHHISFDKLCRINNIENPDKIMAGKVIRLG